MAANKELVHRMAEAARLSGLDKDVVQIEDPSDGIVKNFARVNPATAFTILDIQQGDTRLDFTDPDLASVILTNMPSRSRLFVTDTLFEVVNVQIEPCRMLSEEEAAFLKTGEITITISNSQIEPIDVTRRLSTRMVDGGVDITGGVGANPTSLIQPGTGRADDQLGFPRFPIKGNERAQIIVSTNIDGGFRVNRQNPFSNVQADGLPVKMRVDAIQLWPVGSRPENASVFPAMTQPARGGASVLTGANGGGR